MLEPNLHKTVLLLHQEGLSAREIARRFGCHHKTILRLIALNGAPAAVRSRRPKITIGEELLRELHAQCQGRVQRVTEKLVEEHKIQVSYPTVARRLRELQLGKPPKTRCDRVPDSPGAEMQHDTTVYRVLLGERKESVIASLLYLRYSKRRYLKFYRHFNRFRMRGFFHEALTFWGHAAKECIIDNTNLARLRGTGATALIVPEMACFAKVRGFVFRCHALGHPNRKAGEERSFYTVETNFLPGRIFQSLEDLNRQAFEWATVRMYHRPVGKSKLIPAQAFEHERPYLIGVSAQLCPPYLELERAVDQYGFTACHGNYYWVPGQDRQPVKVLLYDGRLEIYSHGQLAAAYPLPPEGTKGQWFSPPGQPSPPHEPRNRKRPTQNEEQQLRTLGKNVEAYLDFALQCKGVERHRLVRMLFTLWRQTIPPLFEKIVARALRFRIIDSATLERIAVLQLNQEGVLLPSVFVDAGLQERRSYQEGLWTDKPDFSPYERLLEEPAQDQRTTPEEQKHG
jgi:transposase